MLVCRRHHRVLGHFTTESLVTGSVLREQSADVFLKERALRVESPVPFAARLDHRRLMISALTVQALESPGRIVHFTLPASRICIQRHFAMVLSHGADVGLRRSRQTVLLVVLGNRGNGWQQVQSITTLRVADSRLHIRGG